MPTIAPGYSDILGHQRICSRLWAAAREDQLHHCYLFEGPQGVGKATVALRLAMAVNCQGQGREVPCTTCSSCRLIARGVHPDVLHLSPAADSLSGIITVARVRELMGKLQLHRHSARYRMIIVDPAERTRAEATNALLKTLEEPPPGTGFVLISSNSASLLPTVLSRSLRLRFSAVDHADLVEWLQTRGIHGADLLARQAFGSPGLALQLAQGRADELEESVQGLLEAISAGPAELFDYADKLGTGDRAARMKRVELCLEALQVLLRDCTLVAVGRDAGILLPQHESTLRSWAGALWPGGVRRVEQALEVARRRLELNVTTKVVFEALLSCLATELGAHRLRPTSR